MKSIIQAMLFTGIYFSLMCIQSCTCNKSDQQSQVAQSDSTKVVTISCQKNPDQKYAIYLPASYAKSAPNEFGFVFFFEPGARGELPVTMYKELADKYKVILAGSKNSHNGPIEESVTAGNAVLEDVMIRFQINKQFIIASGFSGGGRTAIEFASRRKDIAGVITCGAAFPSTNSITKVKQVPIAEVIGRLDMNFQEALEANKYLKTINNPNMLTFFHGGHQWPPADAFEEALAWQYLKTHEDANAIEEETTRQQLRQAVVQLDSGNVFDASRALMQLRDNYGESVAAKKADSILNVPAVSKKTKSALKDADKC